MKIHTDKIAVRDLHAATQAAPGTWLARCTPSGSRKRDHAFDVALESDGTPDQHGASRRHRRAARNVDRFGVGFAASYADWGHFLAALFEIDPAAIAGPYSGADDFHAQTANVFRVVRTLDDIDLDTLGA